MKTITDIKKALALGTLWHATNHAMNKDMGVREVGANTATQFAFKQADGELSYCNWPKKAEVQFYDDGRDSFTILEDGKPILTYSRAEKPLAEEVQPAPDAGKPEGEELKRREADKPQGWDELPDAKPLPSVTVLSSGVKVKTLAVITNPPRTLTELEADIKSNLLNIANSALRIGGLLALGREFHETQAQFLAWADSKFQLQKSQIYRLMSVHQQFGEDARFKGVAMRVMAQLAGAPAEVKEKAAKLAEEGKLDSKAAEALTNGNKVVEAGTGAAVESLTVDQLAGITTINPTPEGPESGAEEQAKPERGVGMDPNLAAPYGTVTAQEAVLTEPKSELAKLTETINGLMEELGKLRAENEALKKPKAKAAGGAAPMLKQFKHEEANIVLGLSSAEATDKKAIKGAVRELSAIWNADTNAEAWALILAASEKLYAVAA